VSVKNTALKKILFILTPKVDDGFCKNPEEKNSDCPFRRRQSLFLPAVARSLMAFGALVLRALSK